MRSKRCQKSFNKLKHQFSKKHWCVECKKPSLFNIIKKKKEKKVKDHRTLCKSAKCLIHKRKVKLQDAGKKTELKIKPMKKITTGGKCRIKEFEERRKNQTKVKPSVMCFIEGLVTKVSPGDVEFESVLAQNFVRDAINRMVIWPLNKPNIFKGLRAAPRGVLLFGPSGVGKSIMGKHIAFQTDSFFFYLSASELRAQWSDGKRNFVKTLFSVAKTLQPSVIFIEDVDIVFSRNLLNENMSNASLKVEFLTCMDAISRNSQDRILVVAATKRPFDLDDEVLVKFTKKFFLSLPDGKARKLLLEKLLECEFHCLGRRDIEELTSKTEGFTIEEIKQISREASMESVMSLPAEFYPNSELIAFKPISTEDFMMALRMITPRVSKETLQVYEKWDTEYGYGGQRARKMEHWNTVTNFEASSYIT